MLKVEEIRNFSGFGSGQAQGEYFYSQGMKQTQFGVAPLWDVISDADSTGLSGMVLNNWFSQGMLGGSSYVYSFDASGRLFRAALGSTTWSQQRNVSSFFSSHGNGLIFDQKNRLLYANDRVLGMSTDGSAFTDNWKDLGITYTGLRPMDTYEDLVVIGNTNQVAILNVDDDSFNANAFNLPAQFTINCIRSGQNGILIGASFNNRGVVVLWDGNSIRSIAPWIWRNSPIKAIIPTDLYYGGWIVFTSQDLFFTNGYYVRPILQDLPDHIINDTTIFNNLLPQGVESQGSTLFFWGTGSNKLNRQKSGIYCLDLSTGPNGIGAATGLFEFVPVANGVTYGVTGGAIFYDNNNFVRVSYQTPVSTYNIGRLANFNPSQALIISEQLGVGENEKVAEAVKLTLGVTPYSTLTPALTFNIAVKVCNARRNVFAYAITNNTSGAANLIQVDGSIAAANGYNKAQVGDEVTILQGINAGQVKHITAIANQGTNTEQWTVDSNFTGGNTESGIYLNVSPFKLTDKVSYTGISELKELFFNVRNGLKGKKFLVKILFENLPANFMPELKGGQFIYNELSVKK